MAMFSIGCESPTAEAPQIAEVENGLLPFTAISGEPGMDLVKRMQHYQVPGVSIALIEGGQIRWTRHYGVTDVRNPLPIDDTTMFSDHRFQQFASKFAERVQGCGRVLAHQAGVIDYVCCEYGGQLAFQFTSSPGARLIDYG